jgi:hypothetical protein
MFARVAVPMSLSTSAARICVLLASGFSTSAAEFMSARCRSPPMARPGAIA